MSDNSRTLERIAEYEALASAATPGPWKYDKDFGVKCSYASKRDSEWTDYVAKTKHDWVAQPSQFPLVGQEKNNAEFIAAARTAVPELCAIIRKLHNEHETLKKWAEEQVSWVKS